MTTRRRPVEPRRPAPLLMLLAVSVTACATVSVAAAEPVVLLDGLIAPSGVAVRAASAGGSAVEVYVAQADGPTGDPTRAGRVLAYNLSGADVGPPDSASARVVIDAIPLSDADGLTLGWLDPQTLLVAGERLASYRLADDPAVPSEPSPEGLPHGPGRLSTAETATPVGRLASITTDPRHVFGVGGGAVWRGRHASGRLTGLRRFGPAGRLSVAAVATNPAGYLVALQADESDAASMAWRLAFYDPGQPERPTTAIAVEGLVAPVAMVYGVVAQPHERLLFALDAGGADPDGIDLDSAGVYRIDSVPPAEGQLRCVATRVAAVARPQALAAGPDGALYVTALTADGDGVLLRIDARL